MMIFLASRVKVSRFPLFSTLLPIKILSLSVYHTSYLEAYTPKSLNALHSTNIAQDGCGGVT
jgi:hypothetical protein